MAIFFPSIKRVPREEHPLKWGAMRVAGGKGEQPVTEVYIPGRGWVRRLDGGYWYSALWPAYSRHISASRGRAETDIVSFHLLWLGSQQDSVHVVTSHPWGGIRVPSSWGRERGAVGEGIPSHSLSRVGNPLKIICLQICKQDGHFSQPRARRERRKLIASSEAGMLKGQSEATPRCGYFFLCVKKKKSPLLTLKVATAFFFFFWREKEKNESPTNHFFLTMESAFPPGTQLI